MTDDLRRTLLLFAGQTLHLERQTPLGPIRADLPVADVLAALDAQAARIAELETALLALGHVYPAIGWCVGVGKGIGCSVRNETHGPVCMAARDALARALEGTA